MLFYKKPDKRALLKLLSPQKPLSFNYPHVGITDGDAAKPDFYRKDQHRWIVGEGTTTFRCAKAALTHWQMFDLGWVELFSPHGEPQEDAPVAVLTRTLGIWTVNPCRIIKIVDDDRHFGFSYGTLKGHAAAGEEQFLIEIHPDLTVSFQITAYSRPQHWSAFFGYPVMRRLQRRFGRESGDAFRKAVAAITAAHQHLDCA